MSMINGLKITAHIPAREGSKRLREKNLQLLAGIPLVGHAIKAGQTSRCVDELYLNTESEKIADIGKSLGVQIFKRENWLSEDHITQDTFNYDFLKKIKTDILVLINPVCPLIEGEDIDRLLKIFFENQRDSLVTTTKYESHALLNSTPANFNTHEILKRTQDIEPIRLINWAVGIWNAEKFIEHFERNGHATLFGNIEYVDLPKSRTVKINEDEDLELAEVYLKMRNANH